MNPEPVVENRHELARSFAGVADEYERGRPGYPPQAIEWLLGEEPLDVLDLAAGTGKLTRAVLAAGHRLWAVEPLDTMRAVLAQSTPEAVVLAGAAEEIPLADGSVDAVVVGSAFHWFDHDVALREIARVLRAPGVLGLLGNSFDSSEPWVAKLAHVTGPGERERPGRWPDQRRLLGPLFDSIEEQDFNHEQLFDRAGMQDLAISRARLAIRNEDEQRASLAAIAREWDEHAPEQELIPIRWQTHVLRARGLTRSG